MAFCISIEMMAKRSIVCNEIKHVEVGSSGAGEIVVTQELSF